jgi:hypothetical protein
MKIQWRTIWHNKHQVSEQIKENSIFWKKSDVPVCQTAQSDFWPMCSMTVYSVGLSPAKLDSSVSETGVSRNSKIMDESSKTMTIDPDD